MQTVMGPFVESLTFKTCNYTVQQIGTNGNANQ